MRFLSWPYGRACALAVLMLVSGCTEPPTRLRIVDLAEPDAPTRLFEEFPEACFATDPHGNVQVVLRRESAGERDPRQLILQLVWIKTAYRPVPGTGFVEATMINATVRYVIAAGPDAVCYQGAGFVSFRRSRDGRSLTGKLESARLEVRDTAGAPVRPFGPATVTGEFHARDDPRRVARFVRECPLMGRQ